ncbi:heavy-metal-associated domain-containing protein [Achromobacter sp.]|uniref:heavy-metal-associated domain-containing protein n=1 Tax=Achromobacter sp. TaxID=134375 RepID=UPI0028AFF038|nr:heavy-metal-associated domain-containing protein [Achromobacter sp.]
MSIAFQVPDMTCGHCVKTITGAVTEAVPGAVVATDLPTHRVTITGTDQADKVEAAIRDAGYEPSRV